MWKQAYYTFFGGGNTYFDQLALAKRYGCDGIEPLSNLDLALPGTEIAKRLREEMDKDGMGCPCYSMYVEVQKDPEAAVRNICGFIDKAAVLGAPYFHHTIGPVAYPGQPFSEYLANAVSVVRRTFDYAAERGITVVIEPQGLTMNGVEHLSALYEAVDRPIGAVLDTGNILSSPDSCEKYIDVFGKYIRHVHIKDMICRPRRPLCPGRYWEDSMGENVRSARQTVVGDGDLDFITILGKLKALNYTGWYSIEYCAPEDFKTYFPISQQNFAELYRRVFGPEA